MKYLLGIDFGGGSTKATLLSVEGNIIAENSVEYKTYHPTPAACEQSPDDWIKALSQNTNELLKKSGVSNEDILGVAVDSATHTFVVADKNFTPIRNAIHWTDSRSVAESNALNEKFGDIIFNKTFHKAQTIWTLPQLIWLKNNEPENFSKTKYIFFEKDYIRFFLTDVFCTDYIEAEGSMLFDANTLTWDKELCDIAGVEISSLPPVKKPTDIIGSVTKKAAKATGLKEGTPVICGTTDTVMEIFAAGSVNKGDITVKLATAGRICVITDKPCPDKNMINYSHIIDGLWYPGTATKAAASSFRWYRDTFGGDYVSLSDQAEEIPLGAEGVIFHPYINGELTPYADPELSGSFVGVRSTHTKAHFTRAVLEGVAFSLLDCKNYLDMLGIEYNKTATLIGGGSKGGLWPKIVADVLGITLKTTESSDSSFGSCMLAGIALGVFEDANDAVNKCVKNHSVITPNPQNTEKYHEIFKTYKKIHDALAPICHER